MHLASAQVVGVVVALCAASRAAFCADAPDACRSQIPQSLATAVQTQFPEYRLPLVTDNGDDDVQYMRKQGGNGCLGVATGDFDGDGTKDFALALTPLSGGKGRAIVALDVKGQWTFEIIYTEDRARLYVGTVPPDRYQRSVPIYGPLESGETTDLRCPHTAVIVGMTQSTGTVYCLVKGAWRHVVVED